ncbi:SCO family protein [Mariniluteicoccus flavus]
MVRLVGALLVAVALLSACTVPQEGSGVVVRRTGAEHPSGLRGAVLTQPYDVPEVTLTDTAGQRFNLRTTPSRPVTLVFFGYTNCPDVCIGVMSDVASALQRMDPAVRGDVQMVFITTDPARDDPKTVRAYLDRFDPSFSGLTGDLGDIKRAAEALGVAVEDMKKLPSGGYEVGHGAQVVGIGKDDRAHVVWTQSTPIGDLIHDFSLFAQQQR